MPWLTLTEAASAMKRSERTIRRHVERGDLESRRLGRSIQVNVDTDDAVQCVTEQARTDAVGWLFADSGR